MSDPKRILPRVEYYAALGLFYLAQKKAQESTRLDDELNALLGLESGSHVSDAIFGKDDTLDAALSREGIKVEDPHHGT